MQAIHTKVVCHNQRLKDNRLNQRGHGHLSCSASRQSAVGSLPAAVFLELLTVYCLLAPEFWRTDS
jgi:hypothetical protein